MADFEKTDGAQSANQENDSKGFKPLEQILADEQAKSAADEKKLGKEQSVWSQPQVEAKNKTGFHRRVVLDIAGSIIQLPGNTIKTPRGLEAEKEAELRNKILENRALNLYRYDQKFQRDKAVKIDKANKDKLINNPVLAEALDQGKYTIQPEDLVTGKALSVQDMQSLQQNLSQGGAKAMETWLALQKPRTEAEINQKLETRKKENVAKLKNSISDNDFLKHTNLKLYQQQIDRDNEEQASFVKTSKGTGDAADALSEMGFLGTGAVSDLLSLGDLFDNRMKPVVDEKGRIDPELKAQALVGGLDNPYSVYYKKGAEQRVNLNSLAVITDGLVADKIEQHKKTKSAWQEMSDAVQTVAREKGGVLTKYTVSPAFQFSQSALRGAATFAGFVAAVSDGFISPQQELLATVLSSRPAKNPGSNVPFFDVKEFIDAMARNQKLVDKLIPPLPEFKDKNILDEAVQMIGEFWAGGIVTKALPLAGMLSKARTAKLANILRAEAKPMNRLTSLYLRGFKSVPVGLAAKYLDNFNMMNISASPIVVSQNYARAKEQGDSDETALRKAFISSQALAGGMSFFGTMLSPKTGGNIAKTLSKEQGVNRWVSKNVATVNKAFNKVGLPNPIRWSAETLESLDKKVATTGERVSRINKALGNKPSEAITKTSKSIIEFSAFELSSDYMAQKEEHEAKIESGEIAPNTPFKYDMGRAKKVLSHAAQMGAMVGIIHTATEPHAEFTQTEALVSAIRNPDEFTVSLQQGLDRGYLTAESAKQMKGFVDAVKPHYFALQDATISVVRNGKEVGKVKMNENSKIALAVKQAKLSEVKNALDLYQNKTYNYNEGKIIELQKEKANIQKDIRNIIAGTVVKGQLFTPKDVAKMAKDYTERGMLEKQRDELKANGAYKAETVDLEQFKTDEDVKAYLAVKENSEAAQEFKTQLDEIETKLAKIKAAEKLGKKLSLREQAEKESLMDERAKLKADNALFAKHLDILDFSDPHNLAPVIGKEGNIIDGKKRIAAAIAKGDKNIEVLRPLTEAEHAEMLNEREEDVFGANEPNYEGLDVEDAAKLRAARAAYDNAGGRAAGVAAAKESLRKGEKLYETEEPSQTKPEEPTGEKIERYRTVRPATNGQPIQVEVVTTEKGERVLRWKKILVSDDSVDAEDEYTNWNINDEAHASLTDEQLIRKYINSEDAITRVEKRQDKAYLDKIKALEITEPLSENATDTEKWVRQRQEMLVKGVKSGEYSVEEAMGALQMLRNSELYKKLKDIKQTPITEETKPKPRKITVMGKESNAYDNYIPSRLEDVEPDALYTFEADSKEGIPSLLHDKAYANTAEVNGVKTEKWYASIHGDELAKLYPKTEEPTQTKPEEPITEEKLTDLLGRVSPEVVNPVLAEAAAKMDMPVPEVKPVQTFKPNKILKGINDTIHKIATKLRGSRPAPRLVLSVSVDDAKRIADAYEEMKHDPNNPEVKRGFEELVTEIKKQADALLADGYTFELTTKGEGYGSNSEKTFKDVKENKRILVESSEESFGTDRKFDKDNIGLMDSGYKDVNGRPLTNVELIRGVHDLFGHSEYGNGFGAIGEENAWRIHMSMFSPLAQKALTATTRGQNSWVNFGKHMRNADGSIKKKGDEGYMDAASRPFAEQKIGFLPDWATDNAYGDVVELNGKEVKPVNKFVVDGKAMYDIDDPVAFRDALIAARENRKTNGKNDWIQVHAKTEKEYEELLKQGGHLLVSKDGKVGIAVGADGFVGSGFAHVDAPKGALAPLLNMAIKLGARYTDAFDTYLPEYYSKFGFKASGRMKFDEAMAEEGWSDTILKDKPDVVFMYYDGGDRMTIDKRFGEFEDYSKTDGEYVSSYDEGVAQSKLVSDNIEPEASLLPVEPETKPVGEVETVSPKAKEIAGKLTERIKAGKQQAGDLKNIDADQYSEEREEAKTEYEAQLENELEELREAYADVTRSEAELRKIQNNKSKSLSKFVDRLINGTTEQDVIDAKAKLADAKKKYREAKAALTAQLPRERGSNYIIERLSRAARQGEISQEAADLAIDLVRANPELFEDLAISITKAPQGSDDLGFYKTAEALVKVFKGGTDDLTATHELLHHTERFLPLEIRNKILEEWSTQIDKQIADLKSKLAKEKNPDTRNDLINKLLYLGIAKERQVEPNAQNRKDMERIMSKYMRGYVDSKGRMQKGIGKDWYQYSNPSEWWAVNASKLYAEAKNKPQLRTWLYKAKAFYDQLIASAKRVFKGSRTAAVEKGLKAILNGETLSSREGEVLAQTEMSKDISAEQSDLQTIKDFIEEQRKEGVSEEDIKEGVRLAAKELGIKDVDSLFSEKDSTFDPKAEYEASFEGKASSRAIREAKMPFVDKYFKSIVEQLEKAKKITKSGCP